MSNQASLKLKLSETDRTHLTLVFFKDLNNYKKSLVMNQVVQYIKAKYDPNYNLPLIYGNLWGRRSYLVSGPIKELQEGLLEYFNGLGYNIDLSERAHTPHVDARGHAKKELRTEVHLLDDLIM